jgi:hypothetical protein
MENSKIKIYNNAHNVSEYTFPPIKLVMFRYEAIFDFYSENPCSISANLSENTESECFGQILRIRQWCHSGYSSSWCIYAKDRHIIDDVVLRRVIWKMEDDREPLRMLRSGKKVDREKLLLEHPTLEISNKYITQQYSNQIIKRIKKLDTVIKNGIILLNNKNPNWDWINLELYREYDWGSRCTCWDTSKKNEEIEKRLAELINDFDDLVERDFDFVDSMTFNYSLEPQKHIDILIDNLF